MATVGVKWWTTANVSVLYSSNSHCVSTIRTISSS